MIENIAAIAGMVVATVAPYLSQAGTEFATSVGKEAAAGAVRLVGWLREKLTGRAKEALVDLEREPASEDNQADLRKQLGKVLEENSALLAELRALLAELPGAVSTGQSMDIKGDSNKLAQVSGNENKVTIS